MVEEVWLCISDFDDTMTYVATLWITLSCVVVNENSNITDGRNESSISVFNAISNPTYPPTFFFPPPPVPLPIEDTKPLSGKEFCILLVSILIGLPVLFCSALAGFIYVLQRYKTQYIELNDYV